MYCYKRLRDLREDADLTQKEVGRLLNTTQQQYAKYELGVQEIPVHHLIALAERYQVSLDYMVGRADWEEAQVSALVHTLPPEQRKALRCTLEKTREEM